jgi:hypothetical protein
MFTISSEPLSKLLLLTAACLAYEYGDVSIP